MLALIDAVAPDGEESEYNWGVLMSIFAIDLGLPHEKLRQLFAGPPQAQMAQLRQLWSEARRAAVVPSDMTLVEFRKLFDTFKINADTMRRYQPGEFHGRIALICPEEDVQQLVFSADPNLDTGSKKLRDPLKGWGKLATEGVELITTPGDHFTMLREPNAQILAAQLRDRIMRQLSQSATV
jgi:thioesterase domain-containing protein